MSTIDLTTGDLANGSVNWFVASGAQNFSRAVRLRCFEPVVLEMSAPGDQCSGLDWTYDAWGNRNAQSATGGTCDTFQQSANANNQLPGPTYQYDAAGNMVNDGVHTYAYDAENRLTKVDGGSTATYGYDVDGRRVSRIAGGVETDYFYDLAGHPITEYGGGCGATCWWRSNIYFSGQMVAEYFGGTPFADELSHAERGRVR